MPTPTVLIAPDSFKGTHAATVVAQAIADGMRGIDGRASESALPLPIADGGEGTADVLVAALDGVVVPRAVSGPLGDPVEAGFALLDPRTAVVEMAAASGLTLVPPERRDAYAASTRGTGELIAAAVEAGAEHVIVAVGGSATTDGGLGALEELDRRRTTVRLSVICDVDTPWEDAPRVFGPQKGADAATVRRLEQRLDTLADRAPRDPRGVPRTGAAGGLAGGLWAFHDAKLLPGAAYVLDAIDFDARLAGASVVVTGEGALDEQSFAGKAVGEVAGRAGRAGVPCVAVVGRSRLSAARAGALGLDRVIEASTLEALRAAGREIAASAAVGGA
ncbi:MAG: glycerate kinase [Patulibacter sp.]|nr:glycerate kinase [Patulibacter sp.]